MSVIALRRVCLVTMVGALLICGSASATPPSITHTQITTPSGPFFALNDESDPGTIAVEGTSDGTDGDYVDLLCTYGNGDVNHQLWSGWAAVQADGSFTSTASLPAVEQQTCILRAVPGGVGNLSNFVGPRIGTGHVDDEAAVSSPYDGLAAGNPTDFFAVASQLRGYMEWYSASSCGLAFSYPYSASLDFAGDGTIATEPLFNCAGALFPTDLQIGRSEILLDGHSAYTAYGAFVAGAGTPPVAEYPAMQHDVQSDPLTGDLTITETEPLVYCVTAAGGGGTIIDVPFTSSCPHLEPAGVHLERVITQHHEGRQATVSDTFVDDGGTQHALKLIYDDHIGRDFENFTSDGNPESRPQWPGTQPLFSFGDEGYAPRSFKEVVSVPPSAPGTIGIQGDPDNPEGLDNPQGAITYATAPSQAVVFGYANQTTSAAAGFTLRYDRTLPASGSVNVTQVYSQALTRAKADALAGEAEDSFTTPSVAITAPAPGTTVSSSQVLVTGTASGQSGVPSLTVNGASTPVGADGWWNASVTLTPGANTITAVATNSAGRQSQAQQAITYLPPEAPACVVPAVTGTVRATAEHALSAANCTVGTVGESFSRDVPAGSVISQGAPAGSRQGNSFPVDLVISAGPASNHVTYPEKTETSSKGDLTVTLSVPGPGQLVLLGTIGGPGSKPSARTADLKPGGNRRTFTMKRTYMHRGGRLVVRLRPTKVGVQVLRRHRRRHQVLHMSLYTAFTPENGVASTRKQVYLLVKGRT